ncbi:MAG: hypothetical protein JWO86_7857 [Myxococcaceae bacterium]|nr:hypothetical protein [Myxococcaceae bacterium]
MIRRARVVLKIVLVALGAVGSGTASGAPPKPPPARPTGKPTAPAAPLAPLSMLPSIPRVKIDVLKTQLVVIEEVNLPRGEWKNESLDFYVAFGAPGAPRAIDARLVAVADGALEPEDDDAGEALVVDRVPHRPGSAHPLLGKDSMAGVVVHLKRESIAKALGPGNMAALRVRTALDLPDEDSLGARGVVVRLGASRGTPLTLGRLTLAAKAGALAPARAEAHLCGSEADPTPLAIAIVPRPSSQSGWPSSSASSAPASPSPPPIAPVLAVRHASDDLCIRFWTPP